MVDGDEGRAKFRIGHLGFAAFKRGHVAPAIGTVFLANFDIPAHAILLNKALFQFIA
ncbi:hypothetical protein BMNI_I1534 [Brucella melitensis NI]|nr:hypothetical protein BMNI_I1534 [Brucella melitensis NI]EXU82009.1 hypothetical protein AX23_01150 [Brucella melitensis 548]